MARERFSPYGVVTDIPPEEINEDEDVWHEATNIVFGRGSSRRVNGLTRIYDTTPLFQPLHLLPAGLFPDTFKVYGGDLGVGVVKNGLTHHDITPLGFANSGPQNTYTGGKLNGLPFLNRRFNNPWYWVEDELVAMVELPDWPANTTCKAMRSFKFHLFALGMVVNGVEFNDKYQWSTGADEGDVPQSWTAGPTTEAGSDLLAETTGDIVDAAVMRDSLIIYKDTSCYIVTYVAGNNVFANRLLFGQVGALGRNCVAEVYGEHYVFGPGEIFRHDGHTVTPLADQVVRDRIFLNIDPGNFANSFVVYDPRSQTVLFCYPQIGSIHPDICAIYHIADGAWGFRSMFGESPFMLTGTIDEPETADYDSQTETYDQVARRYNETLYSGAIERLTQLDYANSRFYAVGVGNTFDGTLIGGLLRKESLDLGDPSLIKTVTAIWPRLDGLGDVSIRLGSQEHPEQGIDWGPFEDFGPGDEKIDSCMTGRYISVEIIGGSQQQWNVAGFDLVFHTRGGF